MICYYIEDIGAVAKCSSERAEVYFIYDASDGWVRDEWNIVPEYLDESEAIKEISEKEMKQRISSGYTFSLKAYLEQNHIEEDNGTIEDVVKEIAKRSHSAISRGTVRELLSGLLADEERKEYFFDAPSKECQILIVLMEMRKTSLSDSRLMDVVSRLQSELVLSDEDIRYYRGQTEEAEYSAAEEIALQAIARGDFESAKICLEKAIGEEEEKYANMTEVECRCASELMEAMLYVFWFQPAHEVKWVFSPIDRYYRLLGSTLINMKKPREAKTALAKALLWNPTGLISMFEYMEALKQLNDYETYGHLARMSFRYAFRKGQFARCLRNMGFYLIEIDDYASAAVCFQESLQWEDAGTAKSELDYIRHVTGDPVPEVTEELKEEVSDEYDISFTPNKQVTGLAYQMAKNNYNDGDYKASRYFFEILYELTNDEEILDLLGYLGNKGGTENE